MTHTPGKNSVEPVTVTIIVYFILLVILFPFVMSRSFPYTHEARDRDMNDAILQRKMDAEGYLRDNISRRHACSDNNYVWSILLKYGLSIEGVWTNTDTHIKVPLDHPVLENHKGWTKEQLEKQEMYLTTNRTSVSMKQEIWWSVFRDYKRRHGF